MTHLELLKTNKLVRTLSTVQLINYFALMFTQVALFTLLARNDATPLEMSIAAAIFWMPSIILSPFSGIVADRFSPNILLPSLLIVEIIATVLFLSATHIEDFYILLILLFLRSSAGVMYYTTTMSLLPKIIEGESLKKANEIHSIIYSFCLTTGMALGGVVVAYLGVEEAFIIDACLYIVALGILIKNGLPNIGSKTEAILDMLKEGAIYIFGSKKLLFIIAIHAIVATTLFDAIVTLLAKNKYGEIIAIPLAIGFINASRSLASVCGPFVLSRYISRDTLGYFIIAESVSLFLWGLSADYFYTSLVGSFLSGLFLTTIWSYSMTMFQEEVDSRYFGRAIAYNDMFFTFIATASAICIGLFLESGVSEGGAIMMIGGLFLVAGLSYGSFREKLGI